MVRNPSPARAPSPSPARAPSPSPARRAPSPSPGGSKDGGGGTTTRSPATNRKKFGLSPSGRLSPMIDPVIQGMRRIGRSASTGRARRAEKETDDRPSSPRKFAARLPFFHHPQPAPTEGAASPASRTPQRTQSNSDTDRYTQSNSDTDRYIGSHGYKPPSALTSTDSSPPIPRSPTKKSSRASAPSQSQPSRGAAGASTDASITVDLQQQAEQKQQRQQQQQQRKEKVQQQQEETEDRDKAAAGQDKRAKLQKGLSALDKESLESMDQIKKSISEMRTQRRKVKFTGKNPPSGAASLVADGSSLASSGPITHSSDSIVSITTPLPQSLTPHHPPGGGGGGGGSMVNRSAKGGSSKKKMGLGEITMNDLHLSFVKRQESDRSLDAGLQEEIKNTALAKQIKKTKKLIKRTCKDIWSERDQITELQRANWQVRKKLVNAQNVPKDTATTLNLKIEKVVRAERELDTEMELVEEEKYALENQSAILAKEISQLKNLLEELHSQVVPLIPPPESNNAPLPSPTKTKSSAQSQDHNSHHHHHHHRNPNSPSPIALSPSARSSHTLTPLEATPMDESMHST